MVDSLSEDSIVGYCYWVVAGNIFDEFAKAVVFTLADWSIKARWMATDIKDPFHLFNGHFNAASQFFCCRLSAEFLQELLLNISQF